MLESIPTPHFTGTGGNWPDSPGSVLNVYPTSIPQKPIEQNTTPQQNQKCSVLWCTNGHDWPAPVKIARCEGCTTPIVVIELANCPICNEPYTKVDLRVDITSPAIGLTAACKGEYNGSITNIVTLERQIDNPYKKPTSKYPGQPEVNKQVGPKENP